MASKKDFLEFPAVKYATTILSLGPPRSGKTYIMLECVKEWLKMGMFESYHMVLPSFKNEADGSYDWLMKHENVFIYESFHDHISQKILTEQEKANDLFKKGKLKEKPRIFFCVDDATSQGKNLFQSKTMIAFATQNRHYNIHSWFLLHYDKGTVAPKIRQNIFWIFLYPVKPKLLEIAYDDYIDFKEFRKFEDFQNFWDKYISKQAHGCLLLGNKKYNPYCSTWFEK